jgi:hypothetical protein
LYCTAGLLLIIAVIAGIAICHKKRRRTNQVGQASEADLDGDDDQTGQVSGADLDRDDHHTHQQEQDGHTREDGQVQDDDLDLGRGNNQNPYLPGFRSSNRKLTSNTANTENGTIDPSNSNIPRAGNILEEN